MKINGGVYLSAARERETERLNDVRRKQEYRRALDAQVDFFFDYSTDDSHDQCYFWP